MEHNLVEGLQNLRVLAAYDLAVMEDLVKDFASALDEHGTTSVKNKTGVAEVRKRRRFKKRRPEITSAINNSDSDSSQADPPNNNNDPAIQYNHKILMGSNLKQSDSDEIGNVLTLVGGPRYSLSRFPAISAPVLVESDSVTDCFSPVRPPRRRRHLKKMSVDDDDQHHTSFQPHQPKNSENNRETISIMTTRSHNRDVTSNVCRRGLLCRKRKRSVRENGVSAEGSDGEKRFNRACSSCSSGSDDDQNSVDDGREGDDEHSDFGSDSEQQQAAEQQDFNIHLPQSVAEVTVSKDVAMVTEHVGGDDDDDDVVKYGGNVVAPKYEGKSSKQSLSLSMPTSKAHDQTTTTRQYLPGKRRLPTTIATVATTLIHPHIHHHHHHSHASPLIQNGGGGGVSVKCTSPPVMCSPPLSMRLTNNHKRCKMFNAGALMAVDNNGGGGCVADMETATTTMLTSSSSSTLICTLGKLD